MKIFFLATHPQQTNGYARIGYKLTDYLADFHEIVYYGFSNFDCKLDQGARKQAVKSNIQIIDCLRETKNNDPFAVDQFKRLYLEHKPDMVVIYNDVIVTCRFLNVINELRNEGHKFKVVSYLDLVYDFEDLNFVRFIDKWTDLIVTFSEYWKQDLINMGVSESKIDVLPHGYDETFFEIDTLKAKQIFGMQPTDFVILNNNRNSYRKAHDIGISAFLELLQKTNFNRNIKYFIHCDLLSDYGYDIRKLIQTQCIKYKINPDLVMNNHILTTPYSRIEDEKMNVLYNACDVGINTCVGEGFGLCNLEHVALGKPQIVSRVGGLKDIFSKYPQFTIEPVAELSISAHTDAHLGTLKICTSKDFGDRLFNIFTYYEMYKKWAEQCKEYVKETYNWDTINQNFLKMLESTF